MGQNNPSEELIEHQICQEKQGALLDVVENISTDIRKDNIVENIALSNVAQVDITSCNVEHDAGIRSVVESQANLVGMQESLEKTSEHSKEVQTPMNASLHLETFQQAIVAQDLEEGKIKPIEDAITIEQRGEKQLQSKSSKLAKQQSHCIVVSIC